jgi:pentatricopeptide repeat protein
MINLGWLEGKFDEAVQQGYIAIGLEPLSAIDHADLAWTLLTAGKPEEALNIAKTGIELDANSFLSHRMAGLSYMGLKHFEEAIDTFKYLMKISGRHQHAVNSLIWAYCSNGNFEEANNLMNELKERSNTEYIAGTYAGVSAAYLHEIDDAFDYLEKAYFDYDANLIQLKYAPYVPPLLRNDPRFQNLLERIGFPK